MMTLRTCSLLILCLVAVQTSAQEEIVTILPTWDIEDSESDGNAQTLQKTVHATDSYVYFEALIGGEWKTIRYDPIANSLTAFSIPSTLPDTFRRTPGNELIVNVDRGLVVTPEGVALDGFITNTQPDAPPIAGLLSLDDNEQMFRLSEVLLPFGDLWREYSSASVTSKNIGTWQLVTSSNDFLDPGAIAITSYTYRPLNGGASAFTQFDDILMIEQEPFDIYAQVNDTLLGVWGRRFWEEGVLVEDRAITANGEIIASWNPGTPISMTTIENTAYIAVAPSGSGCELFSFTESAGFVSLPVTIPAPFERCEQIIATRRGLLIGIVVPELLIPQTHEIDIDGLTATPVAQLSDADTQLYRTELSGRVYWSQPPALVLWRSHVDGSNAEPVVGTAAAGIVSITDITRLDDSLYIAGLNDFGIPKVWRMDVPVNSFPDEYPDPTIETIRILTTPDRTADGNYGWVQYVDSSVHWIPAECRTELVAEGVTVSSAPWDEISSDRPASYKLCDEIKYLLMSEESSRRMVTTPDKSDVGYAWFENSSGKQWIPEDCRNRLSAEGVPVEILEWTEIEIIPDSAVYFQCDDLLNSL